jgi:hypothetical protein
MTGDTTMLRKLLLLFGVVSLLTLAGCPDKKIEPAAPQATEAELPPGGGSVAGDEDGGGHAGQIRITLNADGTVDKIEGTDEGGNWQGKLSEQGGTPASRGALLTTIELYAHDESEADVATPTGDPLHGHGGATNAPWGGHCHRWAVVQGVNQLVHCVKP